MRPGPRKHWIQHGNRATRMREAEHPRSDGRKKEGGGGAKKEGRRRWSKALIRYRERGALSLAPHYNGDTEEEKDKFEGVLRDTLQRVRSSRIMSYLDLSLSICLSSFSLYSVAVSLSFSLTLPVCVSAGKKQGSFSQVNCAF